MRIQVQSRNGQPVALLVRPQAINILVGDEQPSYSFDRAGRLFGAFVGGRNYRRSLDNRLLCKWREPGEVRERRWLSTEEARRFLEDAYNWAREVAEAAGVPELEVLCTWDWAALEADAARFRQIYKPVAILPPDQYLSLVIQATEGCSYNRCTFCDFYRGRAFRIKSAEELRAHVEAVLGFFGQALALRKSVFLADANALVAPMRRLCSWLDVLAGFHALPTCGWYSFIDAFDVHRKTPAEWQELAARGLRRAYIGLESGSDALLHWLRKPGNAADAVGAVTCLKEAGISASVIVMTGIGGDRYADEHTADTIAALQAMPLGRGDIVYFSPFIDHPGSQYGVLAAEAGIRPVDGAGSALQEHAIRAALSASPAGNSPQLSRYDIREFIY